MEVNVEPRIQVSFSRQTMMATIGATITQAGHGEATIEVPFRPDLTQ